MSITRCKRKPELGNLCDCVIKAAAGSRKPLELAGELTRERGRLVIAGYHQDGPSQVNTRLRNWRGIDVINAHKRDARVYVSGMHAAANAIVQHVFDPTPLCTHFFHLNQLGDALNAPRERPGNFLKILITYENCAG